ncbi:MAG: hypothetical protein ACFCU1_03985 [Sumerlaeia bacterium]
MKFTGNQPQRWGVLPLNRESPAFHCARYLQENNHFVCTVFSPAPVWSSNRTTANIGEYVKPNWFQLEPKTYFPLKARFPFQGNLAWNGGEIFTQPRAGELIREAGFTRCNGLVVEHWSLVPIIRAFQPERMIVLLSNYNLPTKSAPLVVQNRFHEVLEDADEVWLQRGIERKLSLKVLASVFEIFDFNDFTDPDDLWRRMLQKGQVSL